MRRSKQQIKTIIMGFNVSYKPILFFAAIMAIGFPPGYASTSTLTRSATRYTPYSSKDRPNNQNAPYSAKKKVLLTGTQKYQIDRECVPILPRFQTNALPKMLSLDIFSQADPFNYFLTRTKTLTDEEVRKINYQVEYSLLWKKIPQCYTPFAKLLSSYLQFWVFLLDMRPLIEEIKIQRSANINNDLNSLPNDVSSSFELSQLFSPDIFNDPEPPFQLFTKILNIIMQEKTVVNLNIQLIKFLRKWADVGIIPFPKVYVSYADTVYRILRSESALNSLNNLKRDLDEIKRILPK